MSYYVQWTVDILIKQRESPERSQQCIIAMKFILESEANLDERQALRQRSWLKVVA